MKLSINDIYRLVLRISCTLSVIAFAACAAPPNTAPEKKATETTPPSYAQLITSAEDATKNNEQVVALGFFERAAKAEPAKKQPWLRMAQMQFDAHNYGAAITFANEVLVRDNADMTAKSILAASGLRVSANALEQLRAAGALGASTRDEAYMLAKIMKQALGETILPGNENVYLGTDKKPKIVMRNKPKSKTWPTEEPSAVPPSSAVSPKTSPEISKSPSVSPTRTPAPSATPNPPENKPATSPFNALKG
jgi:hypothetical protein